MLGIVIPAYKRKDCLREALQSLCSQTFKRFFVVIIDDHSPEPLSEIAKEFQDKLHIIYEYAEVNGGPGAARQIGLNICYQKGFDLVMFLDSDDMLYPNAIARLTYEINHSMSDIVSSKIWYEGKNGGSGGTIDAQNKTFLHGKIFRTNYLKNNNITFPPIRTNEDLSFNLMAIEGTKKKSFLDETLYLFRYEKSSITRNTEERNLDVHSFDYIAAQYYAAKWLEENQKITYQIAINILVCYNYYEAGKCFGLQINSKLKEQLKYLVNLPLVQDILHNPKEIEQLAHHIRSFVVLDKSIYYFKQTFEDFLKEFIDENSNN